MAGFGGRNHRPGKRPSSSSSSLSVVTVVIFLAFCIVGIWMFSSSSGLSSNIISKKSGSFSNLLSSITYSSTPPPSDLDLNLDSLDDGLSGKTEDLETSGNGELEQKVDDDEGKEKETGPGGEEGKDKETESGGEEGKEQSQENGDGGEGSSSGDGGEIQGKFEQEVETQGNEEKKEDKSTSDGDGNQRELEQKTGSDGGANEKLEQQEQREDETKDEGSVKKKEKEKRGLESEGSDNKLNDAAEAGSKGELKNVLDQNWELCNVTAGTDYIPCLDNEKALKTVRITGHYEHRERHCPEEGPKCLVPLPNGYKRSIEWPTSRDKIWYKNVPRTKLAEVKGHQNWVKVTGDFLTFPGGGTQFIHGALHYIDFIQKAVPRIAWGKRTRVILDVGCGVASFGGYLFERDVLAMSFAPKDEHEAQVQFALERGIPAISAVMGTQRLPFPSSAFDIVHCARCRVPWHADGGALLLELNRVLRPGGYFVWSATPVYQKLEEDVEIWKAMSNLTKSMCWDLVTINKDKLNGVGAAIYQKPVSNECYINRKVQNPPMCKEEDDANTAWYVPLQSCMHKVPIHSSQRGSQWPVEWPRRLQVPPYWLNSSETGIYGKSAPKDFTEDFKYWKQVANKSYFSGMDIDWSKIRNVMDMRAVYGGFAAALKDLKLWIMNVVNVDSPDTLPIIYERGLFGIYHDWCESFSTYPRTYDLLHADHLLSGLKKRCDILPVIVEVDRILRPGGKLIVRDEPNTVREVEKMLKSLHWEIRMTFSKGKEGILCAEKSDWRPKTFSSSS